MLNNALLTDTYNNDGKSKDFRCNSHGVSFGGTYKMVIFDKSSSVKPNSIKENKKFCLINNILKQ